MMFLTVAVGMMRGPQGSASSAPYTPPPADTIVLTWEAQTPYAPPPADTIVLEWV